MKNLVFLKLGGSLITDKNQPRTVRKDILARIAGEIAEARRIQPELSIILGHGSGSFGHTTAKKYGTRCGVLTPEEWRGFAEVWLHARELNQYVVEAMANIGLPVIAFPPSATSLCQNGPIVRWDIEPIVRALQANIIPIVNGDVVFDTERGGTIASTEDGFSFLAPRLKPNRILLAGIEPGVWKDFPTCTAITETITPSNFVLHSNGVSGSSSTDVTGGMAEKVQLMLHLTTQIPGMQALIFSGLETGSIYKALLGNYTGTLLKVA